MYIKIHINSKVATDFPDQVEIPLRSRLETQSRITEWFGVGGTFEEHLVPDILNWTRLLKAPSNLALNTSIDRASTTSLGNLFQHLITIIVKNFFLISHLNLPSFSLNLLPLVLSLQALLKSLSPPFL